MASTASSISRASSTISPAAASGPLVEGPGVGQHHDRLDPLAAQLRHPAVDRVGQVEPAELARELGQQEGGRVDRRDADEADLHAVPLDDLVGRQDQLAAVARDRVGGDVGVARPLHEAQRLGAALVELVVAERADVELHPVRGLDRGLVVEVARDERRGANHVARVHADGAARGARRRRGRARRRATPRRRGPARAARGGRGGRSRRAAAARRTARASLRLGRLGVRVQAEQRYEKSGRESGRSGEQVAALGQWHGRKVCAICRGFVTDSWTLRERAVKGYLRSMRVIDCDCGQTLQAGNDDDLFKADARTRRPGAPRHAAHGRAGPGAGVGQGLRGERQLEGGFALARNGYSVRSRARGRNGGAGCSGVVSWRNGFEIRACRRSNATSRTGGRSPSTAGRSPSRPPLRRLHELSPLQRLRALRRSPAAAAARSSGR